MKILRSKIMKTTNALFLLTCTIFFISGHVGQYNYTEHLRQGDKEMINKNYFIAVEHYKAAQEIKYSSEVSQKIYTANMKVEEQYKAQLEEKIKLEYEEKLKAELKEREKENVHREIERDNWREELEEYLNWKEFMEKNVKKEVDLSYLNKNEKEKLEQSYQMMDVYLEEVNRKGLEIPKDLSMVHSLFKRTVDMRISFAKMKNEEALKKDADKNPKFTDIQIDYESQLKTYTDAFYKEVAEHAERKKAESIRF